MAESLRRVVLEALTISNVPGFENVGKITLFPMAQYGAWFARVTVPGAEIGDRWVEVALCAPMNAGDNMPDLSNIGEVEEWETMEMRQEVEKFFKTKFYNK